MSISTVVSAREDTRAFLERAFSIWRKAQVVHESPAWRGEPEARAIAEEIAASHPECESALAGALGDENALVVAYALITLDLMKSATLQNLPDQVLHRRTTITTQCGSFKNSMDLGGLARQIQKRADERLAGAHKPS